MGHTRLLRVVPEFSHPHQLLPGQNDTSTTLELIFLVTWESGVSIRRSDEVGNGTGKSACHSGRIAFDDGILVRIAILMVLVTPSNSFVLTRGES